MKVWKVTDCDWYAAESYEEAAQCAMSDGMDEDYIFKYGDTLKPLPLTEEELRQMKIRDPDDGPSAQTISGWEYLQQLGKTGRKAMFFASTEY
jgi:hypothetical protein